ncbi:AGAP006892-PA-like protein [Anopheles sinensis]|uniref:AGAP006892-PA-like protein n=1 Tax=Anopheles sinensis TaxID=74873 RepID=A0A084W675_ANOSI|nr:AGAP006892-PA-like protein [Anopheles sinensis]
MVDNFKYDHGQKLQRLDPCEICLCIDGEIFCWWKQCDPQSKTSDEYEQDHLADSSPILDHPALGSAAELSTIINAANATNESANGSTRLALADTLSDGGTTAFSSTVALSTPSSHGHDGDATILEPSVRHGSTGHLQDALEGIPQNILSFPQSPPIMMYRPISSGPSIASNPIREDKEQLGARKKEGKGKGVAHKKAKEHKKSPKAQPSKGFDVKRKPTVSIASDALPRKDIGVTESDRSVREKETTEPAHQQPTSQESSVPEPEQFGGYGFGMIHEPEPDHNSLQQRARDRDVPQHYIITSSGHVEMFDDSGTIGGPEMIGSDHQDVLSFDGRVSSPVLEEHGSSVSESAGEDSSGAESDETDESKASDEGGPVAPAIMLTTNVTQGKYSIQSSTTVPSAPPSSVIDILNTTTLETDYGEGTNHSELIYPEVPSEHTQEMAGSSSGSVSHSIISSSTTRSPTESTAENVTQEEPHCVVLGVTYPVGAEVKKVGLCMYCVCEAGPNYDSSPRVSCTRLNCPPLILPDMLDEAGY